MVTSKLFNFGYKIFMNGPGLKQDKEVETAGADINKLFKDTNLLFLTVYRLHLKKINVLEDVLKSWSLCYVCAGMICDKMEKAAQKKEVFDQ